VGASSCGHHNGGLAWTGSKLPLKDRSMYLTSDHSPYNLGIIARETPCQGPCCNVMPCPVSAAFCEAARKWDSGRKRLDDARDRLNREKGWYTRWRCENWPEGSRMPEKVRDICQNKKAEIVQWEELVKSLEYSEGALRSRYVDLLKQHQQQCGRMPSRLCDCRMRT